MNLHVSRKVLSRKQKAQLGVPDGATFLEYYMR
jgi:hypothetical protein